MRAADMILLAADNLTRKGKDVFTEWDLTLAAWELDQDKFGLRGYEKLYPDHKRVTMEIMGQKLSSPVYRGLMVKVRPNHYQMTTRGFTVAGQIRMGVFEPKKKPGVAKKVALLLDETTPAYLRWKNNPEEPQEWAEVVPFLGEINPDERLLELRAIYENKIQVYPHRVADFASILDFLTMLTYRFAARLS